MSESDNSANSGSPDDAKLRQLAIYNNALRSLYRRTTLAGLGGEVNTHISNRDYDAQFGYPEVINKEQYKRLFDRNGIAHRVVSLQPSECWLHPPNIYDQDRPNNSPFEKAVTALFDKKSCFPVLKRIDVLSGIGNYGVLLFGVDDGKELHEPLEDIEYEPDVYKQGKHKLLYLRPFQHSQVQIQQTEWDMSSPRYGQPLLYQIQFNAVDHDVEGGLNDLRTVTVHWTRILHVADNRETSELFGTPRVQLVYNNILDVHKIRGSSAEMFYKGAYPGFSVEAADDITSGIQLDMESMKRSIELYENDLQRWFGLVNAKITPLQANVQSPADHIRINLEEICIALGCPLRIFMGSESAHLASDQDAAAWNNRLMERMNNYITPYLIKPFIFRLIQIGALPEPQGGDFRVEWGDLNTMTESEKIGVGQGKLGLIQTYATTPELREFVSPQDLMNVFMGATEDESKGMLNNASQWNKEHASNKSPQVEDADEDQSGVGDDEMAGEE